MRLPPGRPPLDERRVQHRGLHRVCDRAPQRLVPRVLPRGIHPVRQQNDEQPTLRVDPDARAREAGVPEGARREVASRARARARRVPAQRAARTRTLPCRPPRDRLRRE